MFVYVPVIRGPFWAQTTSALPANKAETRIKIEHKGSRVVSIPVAPSVELSILKTT
jgi:hypothetical protein